MDPQSPVSILIGAIVFLSIPTVRWGVIGVRRASDWQARLSEAWGRWQADNPWLFRVAGVAGVGVGTVLFLSGASGLSHGDGQGFWKAFGGVWFVLCALPALLRPEWVAKQCGDAHMLSGRRLRQHVWPTVCGDIFCALIGVAMLWSAIDRFIEG